MYIAAFVVLVLVAFVPAWSLSLITLATIAGSAIVTLLFGGGVTSLRMTENDKGPAGSFIVADGGPGFWFFNLAGRLTPSLLGIAGVNLLLEGLAWSLLWVVLVLLFVAYLKTADLFTTVFVLLLGGGIGWALAAGSRDVQEGIAVALVWLLLIGGVAQLALNSVAIDFKVGKPGSKDTVTVKSDLLGSAIVWTVSIIVLWVGTRRLLGI